MFLSKGFEEEETVQLHPEVTSDAEVPAFSRHVSHFIGWKFSSAWKHKWAKMFLNRRH